MKTTVLKFFTLSVALLAFTNISFGQSQSTASADAGANIITPISISNSQGLHFGDIVSQTNAFTVTMSAAGGRSDASGLSGDQSPLLSTNTGNQAVFTITGEADYEFSVLLPTSIELTATGATPMDVDNFTMNLDESDNTLTGGSVVLNVGATLHVNAVQQAGAYTGSFNVTVAYE
ncbi:MAG: DUF4402 domain-containing protein [Bacteroidales bacterium]|jgi:hypothetical protein|nr:DUF4402 domain-containing protein [Bacteroidales bacterium]MCK9345500.1 DUF4402 domain-containing protein [Bacteroidales bacterium]MDD2263563.1 DUF4402 domain-containing protein [Bacteroidales bacterium]MDD2263566.1 DUF4402 domain-containing protein [Bacteroidales bacterium]MDD2830643.1 DUF4402 domain-containing protein [Bacteroidales bacterium]